MEWNLLGRNGITYNTSDPNTYAELLRREQMFNQEDVTAANGGADIRDIAGMLATNHNGTTKHKVNLPTPLGAPAGSPTGNGGTTAGLDLFGLDSYLSDFRRTYEDQIAAFRDHLSGLRSSLYSSTSSQLFDTTQFDPLIAARYTGAGRSRRSVTSTTSGGTSGLTF